MPSCIVCHLDLSESSDSHLSCDNDHPIHNKCLADWLLHSQNCPLCSDPYPQRVLDKFKGFMEEKEREKQEIIEEAKRHDAAKKMEEVATKIIFLKFIEEVENLIDEKKYNDAIEMLMESYNETIFNDNDLQILFLLGKANYFRKRFDLSINFLFKLVKHKFDYPDGFLYLGRSYEALGMKDKAEWAYDRMQQ
ncbi:MAG: RING finger domain-containing protein [Promethearchaeota archaeon]|jgi:tetratricopeptide (TPR) repeat protein